MFRKRTVVTIHGLDYKRAKWGKFASWYLKKGETNTAYYADEIIVLSGNVQRYFCDTYGRETVFIPNGVNRQTPVEANLITDRFGLTKDSYILFLGRIVPEKGIHYLIEAYKKIDTDKKLVIAGGASDSKAYFDKMRELAVDDKRILFTDFVQNQMLAELYSNAYIYVLPSDLEGMPLSLLEAMSYGNCCVVSDIEECASVVEEKGILFSNGNVRDLSEKIRKLLDDKNCVEKFKVNTPEFVCSKYNWDDVCKVKKFFFVINDKYAGIPAPVLEKVAELNNLDEFSEIDIGVFSDKNLESVFNSLDDGQVYDIVGCIPNQDMPLLEYEALQETVSYLMNTEMDDFGIENLVVPDFDKKIEFNGLSKTVNDKLVNASYQEGELLKYFKENPGYNDILQKKFHSIYENSKNKIQENEED